MNHIWVALAFTIVSLCFITGCGLIYNWMNQFLKGDDAYFKFVSLMVMYWMTSTVLGGLIWN